MVSSATDRFKKFVRDVLNFPQNGVLFRDITPLLSDKEAFMDAIDEIVYRYGHKGIDLIAGVEARGFIIGGALADRLGCGFVLIRKSGKLPCATVRESCTLEYGQATLEIHQDAIRPGQHVLIADDVLATGGTAKAAENLVRQLGGVIAGMVFLIELQDLQGRSKLQSPVYSLMQY
jgi:adenine phosphoribosyltransferase